MRKGIKGCDGILSNRALSNRALSNRALCTGEFLTDILTGTRYTVLMRIALGSALIVLAMLGFWRALPLWLSLLNLLLGSLFLLLRWVSRQQRTTAAPQDIPNASNTDANL